MQVIRAEPHVWHRLSSGRLAPPLALIDPTKGIHEPRIFEGHPDGAVAVLAADYPEPPTYRPERGDIIEDW